MANYGSDNVAWPSFVATAREKAIMTGSFDPISARTIRDQRPTTGRLRSGRAKLAWIRAAWLAAALVSPIQATATESEAKLTASEGTPEGKFGISVAVSGDTMVVGAADENGTAAGQGAAYVFTRSAGIWSEQARLTASDPAESNKFGYAVALSGDTIVVGAPTNGGPRDGAGSAYVFVRTGETWSEQAKVTASDGAPADMFGFAVAVSGDTAVVGALWAGAGTDWHRGAAYVFTRAGGTWTEQAKLVASDGSLSDEFGGSVALSGDSAVVAAGLNDVGINPKQGTAYVFTRTGGAWTEQAKLTASDGGPAESFGSAVALSGESLVVSAYFDDIGAAVKQGSVYVFTGAGGSWSQQAKLTASDGSAADVFGRSVAVDGDTIVVGAQWDDAPGTLDPTDNRGSAYVFRWSGSRWTEETKLTAPDAAAGDLFGVSVALSGDTTVVGAGFADLDGVPDGGAAYVFGDNR